METNHFTLVKYSLTLRIQAGLRMDGVSMWIAELFIDTTRPLPKLLLSKQVKYEQWMKCRFRCPVHTLQMAQ